MSGQDLKVILRRIESEALSDQDVLGQIDVASIVRDLIASRTRVTELVGMLDEERRVYASRVRSDKARLAAIESTNNELTSLGFDVHHALEMNDGDGDLVARVTDVMLRMKNAEAELDLLRAAGTLIASRNDGLCPPDREKRENNGQ